MKIISGRVIEVLLEVLLVFFFQMSLLFLFFFFYWSLLRGEELSDYFLKNILLDFGQNLKCGLNNLYSEKAEK